MKKSAGILLIAMVALSLMQFSLIAAESGSGSSDDDDDSDSASSETEVEIEVEDDDNSGSGSVEVKSETKYESNDMVGEVKREIRQEIRDGRVVERIKERVKNESGEFRQEFRQEIRFAAEGEKERAVLEFKMRMRNSNGTVIINEMKIRSSNLSDEQKEIIAGNINARTGLNLTAEDIGNGTALRAILSNGRYAEVKILPDVAARVAVERMQAKCEERNCTVELREVSEGNNRTRAVYRIETEKEARALWIFKTRMKMNAEVDSETGEVVRVAKPWWAFLANEKNELEEDLDEVENEIEDELNETEVEVEANASVNVSAN